MEATHLKCLLLVALSLFVCATGIDAQKKKKRLPRWKIDPYTKNDPVRMKMAGYISFGPFPFGEIGTKIVDTAHVDKHLSYARIIWVETAHFRIGSSLGRWSIPTEIEVRRKLRAELERLKLKLGNKVNPKTRVLDPWLRLHLTAQRMEELYAEIQDWLGVEDSEFLDFRLDN